MVPTLSRLKLIHLLFVGLVLRVFLLLVSHYHPDVGNHLDWGTRFWQYGPQGFYDQQVWSVSWPNQPFATIYLFAFISTIKDLVFNFCLFLNNTIAIFPSKLIWILENNLHVWLVKLPFIFCDIGLAALVHNLVAQFKPRFSLIAAAVFLFNPIVIYNSTIWGQTDSLINLLAILGLYLFFQKKFLWGTFLFFASFTFKMSLLIYLPIFLILVFKNISHLKQIAFSVFITLFVFLITVLPFANDNVFSWVYKLYSYYVFGHQGNMLNGNAFNLWFIIYGADLTRSDTTLVFQHLTAKASGYFLTLIFLVPLWTKLYFQKKPNLLDLLQNCFLTAFTVFILLTNMHERYLYPIFPLITVLLFTRPRFISWTTYIILSLIHLLNLYNLWFYPSLPFLQNGLTYQNFFVGKILSFVLIIYWGKFLLDYFKRD